MSKLINEFITKIDECLGNKDTWNGVRYNVVPVKELLHTVEDSIKEIVDKQEGRLTGYSFIERYLCTEMEDPEQFLSFVQVTLLTDLTDKIIDNAGKSGDLNIPVYNKGHKKNVAYFTKVLEEKYWFVIHRYVSSVLSNHDISNLDRFFAAYPKTVDEDEYLRIKHSFITVFVEQLMWPENSENALMVDSCLVEMREDEAYAANMIAYVVEGKYPYKGLIKAIEAHVLYKNNHNSDIFVL